MVVYFKNRLPQAGKSAGKNRLRSYRQNSAPAAAESRISTVEERNEKSLRMSW
jgi:hypothetical protein